MSFMTLNTAYNGNVSYVTLNITVNTTNKLKVYVKKSNTLQHALRNVEYMLLAPYVYRPVSTDG